MAIQRLLHWIAGAAPILVLLAIVVVGTAIGRDFLQRAQSKASESTCPNNLKEIARATLQYAQDYDRTPPPSCVADAVRPDPADRVGAITWDELLEPYLRDGARVLHCPSDPLPAPARSYAASAYVMGTGFCDAGAVPHSPRNAVAFAKLPRPESTLLYVERWDRDERRAAGRADFHLAWHSPACWTAGHFGDMAWVAFADGHVKPLRYADTLAYAGGPEGKTVSAWRW